MGSKSLLTVLWVVGTAVAATVAWQSLSFVSASTEGEITLSTLPAIEPTTPGTSITTTSANSAPSTPSTPSTSTVSGAAPTSTVDTSTSRPSSPNSNERAPVEQIFTLVGGQAAIRFSSNEIVVVWATPAPGFTVDSHPEDGGVEVEFTNGVHESKLEAWWADGPRSETRERDD